MVSGSVLSSLLLVGLVMVVLEDLVLVKSSVFGFSSFSFLFQDAAWVSASVDSAWFFLSGIWILPCFSVPSVLDLGSFWASSVWSRLVPHGALVHSSLFA